MMTLLTLTIIYSTNEIDFDTGAQKFWTIFLVFNCDVFAFYMGMMTYKYLF